MGKRQTSSGFVLSAILLSTILARSQAPNPLSNSRLFAPYVDMSLTSAEDLIAIQKQTGFKAVTLAFLSASGSRCNVSWSGLGQTLQADKLPNGSSVQSLVLQLQAVGVEVIVSFGGQAGTEPATKCMTAESLETLYQSVIDRYGVTTLDFDIEGKATTDQPSITLRDQALAALKKANPTLKVSYTLGVMPTGLVDAGLNLLRSAKRDDLALDLVNIMAMDYGSDVDHRSAMGAYAIQAAEATEKQIRATGLSSKVGITVMIGVNDERREVFTLADAQEVLAFANKSANTSVNLLSIWSLERDNGSCPSRKPAAPTCSGLHQSDFEFSRAFAAFSK